jgi:hypothetical protein
MIGLITLEEKHAGKRSAGNPHAPFNVAGAGNVAWSRSCDTRRRKGEQRGTQTSTYTGAPVLDPTVRSARSIRPAERKTLIDRDSEVTITRQCELLEVCRSSLYYEPTPVSPADLALMRAIDELHLKHPFLGARRLAQMLKRDGHDVGRRHVGTLMRLMGIEAIYRKKRTSIAQKGHKIYPYLLANVAIERPNQAWAADITYRTPRQRSPPARRPSCSSMTGMHVH